MLRSPEVLIGGGDEGASAPNCLFSLEMSWERVVVSSTSLALRSRVAVLGGEADITGAWNER